ncbi:MAG: prepilin-type N-terminal cleavage/methylation domain-containing protein [Opitutae bacterium]|nr:prepilin-type N-terminal cleavage/methylation domain-containing protein [Opitutae bacterium]MCD8299501.1 prepilin-type N-terminal cleavage/methylation domain-containing protein [Opitutae bacterium]
MSHAPTPVKKAFTLIEIAIVVALLGILCAIAIPAANQYMATRAQAVMQDDGTRLGTAAQAYFAETFATEVTLKYNAKTGKISAPEEFQMLNGNRISEGYTIPEELTIKRDSPDSFQLKHPRGGIYTFNDKGFLTKTEENPVEE